jgi:hypothetical protein
MGADSNRNRYVAFAACLTVVGGIVIAIFNTWIEPHLQSIKLSKPTASHSPPPSISQTVSATTAPSTPPTAPSLTKIVEDERAKLIARYLNSVPNRSGGRQLVACLGVSDTGKIDFTLNSALASRFSQSGAQAFSSLFTPEFVADGMFSTLFAGSRDPILKLELAKSIDALVLARQHAEFATNPNLENVITATLKLEVISISPSGNAPDRTWTFTANGAGFTQTEARQQAAERLIKQINADKTLSL